MEGQQGHTYSKVLLANFKPLKKIQNNFNTKTHNLFSLLTICDVFSDSGIILLDGFGLFPAEVFP